jgi:hypothetical protein
MFTPGPEELTTAISVEVRDLATEVTPADLPGLEKAFLKGLRSVAGSTLEQHEAFESPYHIGLEAQQSFNDAGQRRRRWIRVLYKGTLQARLIAQGKTVEEFDRLRPIFAPCLRTFLFGDLWPEPPGA